MDGAWMGHGWGMDGAWMGLGGGDDDDYGILAHSRKLLHNTQEHGNCYTCPLEVPVGLTDAA